MPQTSRGVPYPAPTSPNDVSGDMQDLAEWLNANPGISPMATIARDALYGISLWDGRTIWNTTTDQLETYSTESSTWAAIVPALVSQAEAEAGTVATPRLWSPLRIAQALAKLGRPIEAYVFNVPGTVATQTGKSRVYLEGDYVVESVRAAVGTAPTGAALVVDVNKNSTTIYTTQSARPSIAAGTNTATGATPAVTTFAAGDYLTVDVDAVGSTANGADLTVAVRLRKVS